MRDARGFTLIEVVIAMVILLALVAGLASATGGFVRSVAEDDVRAAAVQLADDRIQTILMEPAYDGLDAYAGTESSLPALPGYTRTTLVTRVGGPDQPVDYRTVTVTVAGPALPTPVERTGTVAPTTGAQ